MGTGRNSKTTRRRSNGTLEVTKLSGTYQTKRRMAVAIRFNENVIKEVKVNEVYVYMIFI